MKETANPLLPPPLCKGDTIGLVSPAGPLQNEIFFTDGVRMLHEIGFRTKFERDFRRSPEGYLAGSDEERLSELHELWADQEVKAILAVRGGYGSLRIIDGLDLELLGSNPKILIGFSDITALLNEISDKTGLVTFHGPVLTTLARSDRQSVQAFFDTVTGRMPQTVRARQLEILRTGRARGKLLGGNLSTLVHLVSTPHEASWSGCILFLEDVGEAVYRIDRMLTHLKKAGRLDSISGLVLGSFTADLQADAADPVDDEPIWNRVLELTAEMDIPVWANFPCGHGRANHILPIGIEVELDSDTGTLRFLEQATLLL